MANPFQVEVISADRKLFRGPVSSITLPGVDGYFGVLRGHAPLIAALGIGEITITTDGAAPIEIAVAGGFAEVLPDHVVVLADVAELAEEIDVERARHAQGRAEERLRGSRDDIDTERARLALLRALNRLRVAERRR